MNDISAIKAAVNIVDIIEDRIPLKKTGNGYTSCCPFHDEKTPSFTVSPDKQFYHCFGCGAHGDVIDFIVNYDGLSVADAIRSLGGVTMAPDMRQRRQRDDTRAKWLKMASHLFDLILDLEDASGDMLTDRARVFIDGMIGDLAYARARAVQRAAGESVAISTRDHHAVVIFIRYRPSWREIVRRLYVLE